VLVPLFIRAGWKSVKQGNKQVKEADFSRYLFIWAITWFSPISKSYSFVGYYHQDQLIENGEESETLILSSISDSAGKVRI
jgi:hypothetical protein